MSIKLVIFFLVVCLSACATQPSGSHSFEVAAVGEQGAVWSLRNLAEHGRIELTGHLSGDSDTAAYVMFKFSENEFNYYLPALSFSDRRCKGAYTIELSNQVKAGVQTTDYFSTVLSWDAQLHLQIEWWGDGRLIVVVNGIESKTIERTNPIDEFVVEAKYGRIHVDNLTYSALASL